MSVAIEPSFLIGHFTFIDRLAPPERLRVLPPEGLKIPPVLPRPGATALLPITVRLQCEDAVHHPGALPSLRPERQKDTSRSHGLHERVCVESKGVVTSCCSCKQSQVVVPHPTGFDTNLLQIGGLEARQADLLRRHQEVAHVLEVLERRQRRAVGLQHGVRRRVHDHLHARTRVAQRAPSRHSGDGGGNERDK